MTEPVTQRLTLATATGLPFLVLAFHFGVGLTAIATGSVAMAARKGGTWHRKSGVIFVYAMIALGLTATGIGLYEGKPGFASGSLAAYFALTAYTTVKPLPAVTRRAEIALMLFVVILAALGYKLAFTALAMPGKQIGGAPAGMLFFLNTIVVLAAIGDARVLKARGIQGTRRLARHLWRMSFSLFIATGSFFLGQMKFIPKPIRIDPLLYLLAVGPLLLLVYWLWRVRLRQNLRGLITGTPAGVRHVVR